jgi:pyruvate dehydrogenase E2 component (dihydrolipoamide acetyltransferase)
VASKKTKGEEMIEAIKVPDIGENVEAGKVVAVHIKTGEIISVEDPVIELETDKAVVEIPSPIAGKVVDVLAQEGSELKVGEVIATVETAQVSDQPSADAVATEPTPEELPQERTEPQEAFGPATGASAPADLEPARQPAVESSTMRRPVPASPSIRRMARELGIDITTVAGSGPGGRITDKDIKQRAKQIILSSAPAAVGPATDPPLPDFSRWGDIETTSLETVRHLTAQSTAASWRTVAHVTQFDEADITALDAFGRSHAGRVEQAGGKLTLTPILTLVCAQALLKYPRFNASIDVANQRLILKKYIHIGIATATERGLLVPVIRNADTKNILELAVEIVDLAGRARSKKLKPDEMEGGTFTISNQGGIGGVGFTPIVLWPQAAILGVSRASTKPRYIEGQLQARKILPLSLSYDHRILDGADAAQFLNWICRSLEQAFTMHLD